MARLIHLNGPPGIGKSTIARRYVDHHPGTLNLDIDELRRLVGGWRTDFERVGDVVRPIALSMAETHLRLGGDVVMPQYLGELGEVARFESVVLTTGAEFVEVVLMDTPEQARHRFHARGSGDGSQWHRDVKQIVERAGGDAHLAELYDGLLAVVRHRPAATVVWTRDGDVADAYRAVVAAVEASRHRAEMPEQCSVQWVVLDLGETLVDETANWCSWAEFLQVPLLTFFAAMGAAIADRRPHTDVFQLFCPGRDVAELTAEKAAAGLGWSVKRDALYADALPAINGLREAGYRVAVMANQPTSVETFLATLDIDRCGTSESWGVAKPDPAFFARIAAELQSPPECIAYVGDRVDNDVLPALAAGMWAIHLRRGPWGLIQARWPEASRADAHVTDLLSLPEVLGRLRRLARGYAAPQ